MSTKAGMYEVMKDTTLLMWDSSWEKEYITMHDAVRKTKCTWVARGPAGYGVKVGNHILVEYGEHVPIITIGIDTIECISSLPIVVTVDGTTVYRGVRIVYNKNVPSIVDDNSSLRPIKMS